MMRTSLFGRSVQCGRLAGAVLVLATCGCASVGPKTIPRDQFDYGMAIAGAQKEQLLSNIVGLRYLDAPIFINVSSVINQYSLEGRVSLGAGLNTSAVGENTLSIGGASRWSDRPTITYNPISGKAFARSLLTPILPEALFALVQAGWPSDLIFRVTVRSMNGIGNEWASPANRRQVDPRFVELLQSWKRLRNARAIGLRREGEEAQARILVYQTKRAFAEETRTDIEFLREALELDQNVTEYRLSYGLVPSEPNEIMVLTSSIIEIMNELAWRIDVPPEHIDEGRTATTFIGKSPGLQPLIRIHASRERPTDTYVAVRNRDYWFYIDDRDVLSKRTFAILQIMLSLTDSGDTARGPVVSITN